MAQYPIPQFIEEEGRIVFFLTFRQFFLLVGGAAACVLLYAVLPFFLFSIFSLLIMGFVGMIAFFKIGNEGIVKVVLHFLEFSTNNKNYIWQKDEYQPQTKFFIKPEATKIESVPQAQKQTLLKTTTKSRLSETKKMIELTSSKQ